MSSSHRLYISLTTLLPVATSRTTGGISPQNITQPPHNETHWSSIRSWIVRNWQILIVSAVKICQQCLQTASAYRASPRYKAQALVCRYVGPPGECYYNTLLCCHYFSSSSVVSCAFSKLCTYLKFGRHPHPLGYLCAKFRFVCSLHYGVSPWRKIVYSITQSPS